MVIHIFNPDTDYALASGSYSYNPPKSVVQLADRMALFPACYAAEDDAVVAYSDIPQIKSLLDDRDIPDIRPWGWNHTIRRRLLKAGVPPEALPSPEWIDALRRMSHRRTTIKANIMINDDLTEAGCDSRHISPIPMEFSDPEEAIEWLRKAGKAYFKAPWSSSGRGVLFTEGMDEERINQWIRGIIGRQGSVMAEFAAERSLDFATEWTMFDGEATFEGYSLFETSHRGKYHGNSNLTQDEILDRIKEVAPDFNTVWIAAQKRMLENLIPEYDGPLGIDMLATSDGAIRSCVEINLRMTMGYAKILEKRREGHYPLG